MTVETQNDRPFLGLLAFFVAALALAAVTLHVSGVFSEPEQSAGQAIGQIAADIRDSARAALTGEEIAPPPERGWNWDRLVTLAVPVLAAIATILGGISLFRGEAPSLPRLAVMMGIGAFVMQFVFWLAVLICAVALLIAVIQNLDVILGG